MLLAELEVWHSRPVTPTRRVALGHLVLPVDPTPGFGGLLLGAVIAAHLPDVDEELVPDIHRLLDQVSRGERVVQPRLRHRYQVDRHGLAVSVHRLEGEGDNVRFDLHPQGTPLAQVLGAIYAVERLDARGASGARARRCTRRCDGAARSGRRSSPTSPVPPASTLATMADPKAWALELLGFPIGTGKVTKKEVMAQFRSTAARGASRPRRRRRRRRHEIERLGEARRILLA